jgi:hypothetical protein
MPFLGPGLAAGGAGGGFRLVYDMYRAQSGYTGLPGLITRGILATWARSANDMSPSIVHLIMMGSAPYAFKRRDSLFGFSCESSYWRK